MKKLLFLQALLLFACSTMAQNDPNWNALKENGIRVAYGPGENQWINIYPVKSDTPAPVYVWGHPNSDGKIPPSANDIPVTIVGRCNDAGIAVISWESVPQCKGLDDVTTCEEDLEKLYLWLLDNAGRYNIDVNNLFIGGASRGTVVSWKFANAKPGRVRGVFYAQGLPKGAWADGTEKPLQLTTKNSPPVVFVYRDPMDTKDGHSPKFGQRIVDRYNELGIGNQARLYHSLGKNYYNTHLVDFIKDNLKK